MLSTGDDQGAFDIGNGTIVTPGKILCLVVQLIRKKNKKKLRLALIYQSFHTKLQTENSFKQLAFVNVVALKEKADMHGE